MGKDKIKYDPYMFQIIQGQHVLIGIGVTQEAMELLRDSIIKTLERKDPQEGMVGVVALQLDPSAPAQPTFTPGAAPKNAFEMLQGKKLKGE
ncbi:hypothetical protein LCGC14_1561050 [marine sediment metagenome]|uniref:Uncharacterized protein n=1 Tax=marine sediment metagenome TaxID=412755 RepID=A0A0F9LN88_9ZZZZ